MIDAGLPLVQCLEILGTQEEDKNFAEVILATRGDVESGASLADAMKKHPKVFDPLFTNMIAAGEAGGILDTILKRLATYIEKAVKLKGQVKSAMIYPVAVIVIATLVVGVILWKVIPTFANLFAGLGAELPLPTRVVIAASSSAFASVRLRLHATTGMPNARARAMTSRPIVPVPSTPSVRPKRPRALPYSFLFHVPSSRSVVAVRRCVDRARACSPKASSATAIAFLPGTVRDPDAALARGLDVDRVRAGAGANDELRGCPDSSIGRVTFGRAHDEDVGAGRARPQRGASSPDASGS